MLKRISDEEIMQEIIDDADCRAFVCFTASDKTSRLLGWARELINQTADAQLSADRKVIETVENPYPITRYFNVRRYIDEPAYNAFEACRQAILKEVE